jgi:uncharacterized protein (DUF983 family)
MFKYPFYNFLKFEKMNTKCSNCDLDFIQEPGFYLGAMYVSYFISSFILLFSALFTMVFLEKNLSETLIIMFIIAILILPYTLRISRTLWLLIAQKK